MITTRWRTSGRYVRVLIRARLFAAGSGCRTRRPSSARPASLLGHVPRRRRLRAHKGRLLDFRFTALRAWDQGPDRRGAPQRCRRCSWVLFQSASAADVPAAPVGAREHGPFACAHIRYLIYWQRSMERARGRLGACVVLSDTRCGVLYARGREGGVSRMSLISHSHVCLSLVYVG